MSVTVIVMDSFGFVGFVLLVVLNIKLTFILSLVSAVLGFFGLTSSNFAFTSAALIFFSILATIYLVLSKKDQTWYRSRALAESVKSISLAYSLSKGINRLYKSMFCAIVGSMALR